MTDQPRPHRIHMSRQKGADVFRLARELNGLPVISVVRSTRWGNPFSVAKHGPAKAAALFQHRVVEAAPGGQLHPETIRRDLHGFNLACTCRLDEPCHADTLLALANSWELPKPFRGS